MVDLSAGLLAIGPQDADAVAEVAWLEQSENATAAQVRDTRAMLAQMSPVIRAGRFVFCTTDEDTLVEAARGSALSWFREDEGITMILEIEAAAAHGFDIGEPMSRVVLSVFSALDGIGLTAAVATALADERIPCNVIAAYHHDNIFVPTSMAERAMEVLRAVQAKAAGWTLGDTLANMTPNAMGEVFDCGEDVGRERIDD
jgi:hypothetical protein